VSDLVKDSAHDRVSPSVSSGGVLYQSESGRLSTQAINASWSGPGLASVERSPLGSSMARVVALLPAATAAQTGDHDPGAVDPIDDAAGVGDHQRPQHRVAVMARGVSPVVGIKGSFPCRGGAEGWQAVTCVRPPTNWSRAARGEQPYADGYQAGPAGDPLQ
jgi:hypothetical protein